jgi:hypothetical protein
MGTVHGGHWEKTQDLIKKNLKDRKGLGYCIRPTRCEAQYHKTKKVNNQRCASADVEDAADPWPINNTK